jgi:hypothetical protein
MVGGVIGAIADVLLDWVVEARLAMARLGMRRRGDPSASASRTARSSPPAMTSAARGQAP